MTAAAAQEQATGVNVRPATGRDEARPQTNSQAKCRPPVPVPGALLADRATPELLPAGGLLTEAGLW
ncbi:hypothetical protein BX286_0840 [Streptomyces sp. 3211.6]|uniref:hypothetical protein n=1 Tax=Streptomyces sp. 3211.6 TaxID=1938845 RepID=UPI000F2334A8|nr:hypothetical protein [Streptomyces sp. 3211.6]RKT02927.1 hypothetical protein BX286_0840 [Streptomyces sp. 3211.6]